MGLITRKIQKPELTNKAPSKAAFALLFLGLVLIFLSGYYYDLVLITEHSLKFWDILFNDGIAGLAKFYSSAESMFIEGNPSTEAPYNIFVYILLAVLNIPTMLLRGGEEYLRNAFPALLWSKFVIMLLLAFAVYCFYKLLDCFDLSTDQKYFGVFMFCSSIFLVSATVYTAQIDIGGVAFTMLGLRAYLKNDRKQMYIFFMIACLFKLFALFIFIPLMLLREKRVLYFLRDVVFVMLPFILTDMILFAILDPDRVSQSRFFLILTFNNLPINDDHGSVFIMVYIIIAILCYNYKLKSNEVYERYVALYVCIAVFTSFIVFSRLHTYWCVLIVPYITILLLVNKPKQKINLFLEIIGSSALVLSQMIYSPPVFAPEHARRFALRVVEGRIVEFDTTTLFVHLVGQENYNYFAILLLSIFAACFIGLLIVNFPKSQDINGEAGCDEKQFKYIVYLRAAISVAIMFIPAFVYLLNVVVISKLNA